MIPETAQVREDFDRIALLTQRDGGQRTLYHSYLLSHLPQRCESALEIGCGAGAFTRLLATRARSVVGCDLSPQMIRLAQQQHSASRSHIEYMTGDVMRLSFAAESFDCIVTVATLHHLPLAEALLKMKDALKPGGRLIIQDMVADDGLIDRAISALAYPVNAAIRFRDTGHLLPSRELRTAWKEHGQHESYLTLNEVKEMCKRYLPGAFMQRHLLWRYTVVWNKNDHA
ncbi:MAG TPA: class I SAM-dependent methyltransferase [Pyrinomonadaceae bacterium]|jgi:SAM-dependent methyltransferase